jgi:hypothetical protein
MSDHAVLAPSPIAPVLPSVARPVVWPIVQPRTAKMQLQRLPLRPIVVLPSGARR